MTEPTQAPIVLIEPTPVLRRELRAMTEPTQAQIERKRGNSKLVYDKKRRTIIVINRWWWQRLWYFFIGSKRWP